MPTLFANKVFLNDTNIYLEDKQLELIYDLKQAPYIFTAEKGKFNNRFVLRYTNETLDNPSFTSLDNSVVVTTNHVAMGIKSNLENMQEVTVFDVLGRTLLTAKPIAPPSRNHICSCIAFLPHRMEKTSWSR